MSPGRRCLQRSWLVAGILGLYLPIWALAGTTGKVAGRVGAAGGAPVPGVAVTVEGTRLGASTDADGRYIILQVPPGEHTVTAQLVGFRTVSVTNVRVNADLTAIVDFTLTEEAIEVQPVTVTATRPPIEKDVTSSQIIVDSRQVYNAPVARVIDYMGYEPGVVIGHSNEINIRGGGPEEVSFEVDNLSRVDALTSKGLTHLNLTMVSEVTVLTGGFNAEYGNMRSGVVNAVYKDGTERGWGLPWLAGVVGGSPAAKKHFGPGAYDPSEYVYRVVADSSITHSGISNYGSAVYWPDLYPQTRADTALQALKAKAPTQFLAIAGFSGWTARAASLKLKGAFGKKDWNPAELREAWQWEANMNEPAWQYGNKPDENVDLSLGQALPHRLGGIVVGYSYAKVMTAVPAIRPFYSDQTIDAKLTLTPSDQLKIHLSGVVGKSLSVGAASENGAAYSEELASRGGGGVYGNAPVGLRAPGDLLGSVTAGGTGEGSAPNKLNLAYNAVLNGTYNQVGALLTYTFSPRTYLELGASQLKTKWDQPRPAPRVNVNDFSGKYGPPVSYAWGGANGFLDRVAGMPAYIWKYMPEFKYDGTKGSPEDTASYVATGKTVNYPTRPDQVNPANIIPRSPFDFKEPYPPEDILKVQQDGAANYVTKTFDVSGTPNKVTIVSPQGWVEQPTADLSGLFNLGEDSKVVYNDKATGTAFLGSLTHAVGANTFKLGGELNMSSVEIYWQSVLPEARSYSRINYYTAKPVIGGAYLQDKFESEGMIVNVGARADYFDAGSPVYTPDNIFDYRYWHQGLADTRWEVILDSLKALYPWRVWPLDPRNTLARGQSSAFADTLKDPLTSQDLIDAMPQRPAKTYWRFSPRIGVSHPVSDRTKLFFNYGIFYNMAAAQYLHGFGNYESPMGSPLASVRDVSYADLRPPKTTMYEVGIEHSFARPGLLLTMRGYAKYNTDQVSYFDVVVDKGQEYHSYRNGNWEDIRGLEIKLARMTGRFFYGWATYNYIALASGQVGYYTIYNNPLNVSVFWPSLPVTSNSPNNFQGLFGVRTPDQWGVLTGGWNLSVVQAWSAGGEVIYNPQGVARVLLPTEYIMRNVDYWNTDLRLQKSIRLGGGRSLEAYLDVSNLWNTKRLAIGHEDYTKYVIERRSKGGYLEDGVTRTGAQRDLRYGDSSTWFVFTQPYKDVSGAWHRPIAPALDWCQFLNPRAYRLGVRINL